MHGYINESGTGFSTVDLASLPADCQLATAGVVGSRTRHPRVCLQLLGGDPLAIFSQQAAWRAAAARCCCAD